MKRLLPLIILLVPVMAREIDFGEQKKPKSFSIFSVVQFQNNVCTSPTVTPVMRGTCFTASECTSSGGTASGSCASGFGVCCMFMVSACSSTISKNLTYIQNPNFPAGLTTTGTCTYTVSTASDICQIRLDFDNFVTANPVAAGATTIGNCPTTDRLVVTSPSGSGFNANPPVLCGTLTGSHMYVETGRQNPSLTSIAISNALATTPTRTYKIKVTYIECNNPLRAPTDCLQYYTGVGGSITSFNYQGGSTTAPGQLISNLLYTICIRQEEGYCFTDISQSDTNSPTIKAFSLDSTANAVRGTAATAPCSAAQLTIPTLQSTNPITVNTDQYCGNILGQGEGQTPSPSVIRATVPTWIGVVSAQSMAAIAANAAAVPPIVAVPAISLGTGFNLEYSQVAC